MKKKKGSSPHRSQKKSLLMATQFLVGTGIGLVIVALVMSAYAYSCEERYKNLVYPGIEIAELSAGGLTRDAVISYWRERNSLFNKLSFTFTFEDSVATLSAESLNIGFDATLSATQAYSLGRSGNRLTDLYLKLKAQQEGIMLQPMFYWDETHLDELLNQLALEIDVEAENALFEFVDGRVTAFKPAKPGRKVDVVQIKRKFNETLATLPYAQTATNSLEFTLPVITQEPLIKTDQVNGYGLKVLLGQGESWFKGSIPGRIHNVALAASRINGVLIPPGTTFSFNDTVGDISAATGYKQAYVIKSGRTVLDDGGGVCQVSTTLFRAALNAGLPIKERHAHSYRVGYYEQGGWKPGFDATVYAPSYDLKFTNDTPAHILIQAKTDTANTHLTFELYGTSDGRSVELSNTRLWDSKPAPPDLYQDDPTLPVGTVKQVDWANSGIKAAFDYTVRRNDEVIFEKTFTSNFIPWQAVFLRGTKT